MRLQQLQLIRYGKFTDAEVSLPKADHDFHFIVGPNEAGKSTVRTAIAELLFGFPVRSGAMAFLHPQSELRLAAQLADGGNLLDFHRVKANKNTLRTPTDAALPDDALIPYLGTADRDFFEQMFGLDHGQLVRGGQTILDASKDVSQVLFQSAAGIAGLGKVKDALVAEADKLWGPRASGSRVYYAASARWEEACKELKALTIRTKVWSEAREKLADIEARIEAAHGEKTTFQTRRTRLERVRRIAPTVQALRARLEELRELGEVLELPADASVTLSSGEAALSVAKTVQEQREQDVHRFKEQRDGISYDASVLELKTDIEELEAFAQRVRDHHADLKTQQREYERFLGLGLASASELGWPEDGEKLRKVLPAPLAVRDVQRLVTTHGKLLQATNNADNALESRQGELDTASEELEQTSAGEVSPSLRSALSETQAYKNTAATQAKLAASVTSSKRALDAAVAGLGQWVKEEAVARKMVPPSVERLAGLSTDRQRLEAVLDTALDREVEAREELDAATLEAQQYAEARRIVTALEVREARRGRDTTWAVIKDGSTPLASGASSLDAAIALADELVDTQLGSATEAAELQSLRQRVERAELELTQRQATAHQKRTDLAAFDQRWSQLAESLGLPGLELVVASAWFARRDQFLAAADAHAERQTDLEREVETADAAAVLLRAQLGEAGLAVDESAKISGLLSEAEEFIATTDAANTRRKLLAKQIQTATSSLRKLSAEADAATAAYREWQASWDAALAIAKLSGYVSSVSDAEQALVRVETVRSNLEKAAATKRERIDTMNADLDAFNELAKSVVSQLGTSELAGAEARLIAQTVYQRLRDAEGAHQRWGAADESLGTASRQLEDARNEVERQKAKLAPLLTAAGVATMAEVAPLVERSDRKRYLVKEIQQARDALTKDSDGLGFDAVVTEVDKCDLTQLAAELGATSEALEEVQSRLTKLAEGRLQADQEFEAIDGGKDAASAESRRQEALADMAEASERYLKVTTAVRLLAWAIDRYRDQKQGPMLARAGVIFSTLTLGRYSKLFVDYEKTPLSLSALRTDGRQVEVAGMSEGTRDQLYLALRFAALELHLGQAKSLPFVADDLFINFDDERSTAGLEALRDLSTRAQVLFLSHHDHLLPRVRQVFGDGVNVVQLER
jgi:uncharacterized protein YhaN